MMPSPSSPFTSRPASQPAIAPSTIQAKMSIRVRHPPFVRVADRATHWDPQSKFLARRAASTS